MRHAFCIEFASISGVVIASVEPCLKYAATIGLTYRQEKEMSGDKRHSHASADGRPEAASTVQNAAAPATPADPAAETASAAPARSAEGAAAPRPLEPAPLEPTPLLTRLLCLADKFRAEDSIHQAMSIYFELAEEYAGAPEAYDALERLLEIAKNYEDAGELREAQSLYERLL